MGGVKWDEVGSEGGRRKHKHAYTRFPGTCRAWGGGGSCCLSVSHSDTLRGDLCWTEITAGLRRSYFIDFHLLQRRETYLALLLKRCQGSAIDFFNRRTSGLC